MAWGGDLRRVRLRELNGSQFTKFAEKVERDVLDGQKLGVNGTPTFYINGKRVSDRSYEGLRATIETALKE